MASTLFPMVLLGRTFQSFYEINLFANKLWFIQITLCLLSCIKSKIHLPSKQHHQGFLLKQFYSYLIFCSIIYVLEMIFNDIFFENFEQFLHHFLAILFFAATLFEPHIICTLYLVPVFLHSVYWLCLDEVTLNVYNVSLLCCPTLIMVRTYRRSSKRFSARLFILIALLFNANLFGYLYGYNVNLFELNVCNLVTSLVVSVAITSPFYFYMIYVNLGKMEEI